MGELWRSVSELMWKRPSLWLPVLIADLLGFFMNLGRLALVRAVVLRHAQYHSALGGPPMRAPMTASAAHSLTTMVIVIDWTSYLIRLLLYASAFITTAALVRSIRERLQRPWGEVLPALQAYTGGIFSLSLRALAIYGAGALLFGWLGSSIASHGHKAWLANGWFETGVTLILMIALSLLLAPVAIQVLAKRYAPPFLKQRAQLFALSLGMVALALGTFIAANMRTVRGGASVTRTFLELTGSWIVALPYAVLFVGLTMVASEIPYEAETPSQTETAA